MKKLILLCVLFGMSAVYAEALNISGDFSQPRKAGAAPKGWNILSGSKGMLEIVRVANGNGVLLNSEKNGRFGIYTAAIAAKAGDRIRVSAFVRGEKIVFGIFQYGNGRSTGSNRKNLTSTTEGSRLEHTFTVSDSPRGKTDKIRVVFWVEKGGAASIVAPEAFREAAK